MCSTWELLHKYSEQSEEQSRDHSWVKHKVCKKSQSDTENDIDAEPVIKQVDYSKSPTKPKYGE